MKENLVGIGDMALYVPEARMELATILARRAQEDPSFERRLRRAIDSTGQISLRFPAAWEDPVTMAAQAVSSLLDQGDDSRASRGEGVRYLATGTETSVDLSKPVSAYMQGALQRAGHRLPTTLSTFQVQHACAGGTIALTSVAALVATAGPAGGTGVVTCTDIARYQTPSTAEITQGAGAVAMMVERNPHLLALDLDTIGLYSSDVDDFFRPLGSVTARVQGRYSVDCYNEALEGAFTDHCARRNQPPGDVLRETDIIVVHVPFHRMAVTGTMRLVERQLGVDPAGAQAYLEERRFGNAIEATRVVGNTYSASAYMTLMWALYDRYQTEGDAMAGKRVLLASYGSGNTMTVLSGTIQPKAPEVVSRWDLPAVLTASREATWEEYAQFISRETYTLDSRQVADPADVPPHRYFLESIREDGYRVYGFSGT